MTLMRQIHRTWSLRAWKIWDPGRKCRLSQGQELVSFTREGNPRGNGFGREKIGWKAKAQLPEEPPFGLLVTCIHLCSSTSGNPRAFFCPDRVSPGETQVCRLSLHQLPFLFLALQPSPCYAQVQSPCSSSPMPVSCDPQSGSRSEWRSSPLLMVTWAHTRARTMGQISKSWLSLYPVPGYPQGLESEGLQIKCIENNWNPIYFSQEI